MAHPPKDVSASDLFTKLTEAPRPSEVIDWPRKVESDDGTMVPVARVRVRVLNQRDVDEARLRAHVWLREKRKMSAEDISTLGVREVLGDAIARQMLCRAIVHVDPIEGSEETGFPKYARIFMKAEDLEKITPDELVCLFQAYELVQRKYGPYEGNLNSPQEISAWVKRLSEGAQISPLAQASSLQLAELATSLAQRAYTLSQILESLRPSLDESLVAALSILDIGTGLFTPHASMSDLDALRAEELANPVLEAVLDGPDAQVTIALAAEIAKRRSMQGPIQD